MKREEDVFSNGLKMSVPQNSIFSTRRDSAKVDLGTDLALI